MHCLYDKILIDLYWKMPKNWMKLLKKENFGFEIQLNALYDRFLRINNLK